MHRILGNASWLMVERALTMAVNFGVMVFIARELGPDLFGSLNYVLAIVGLIAPLAALGLNAIVTRELANAPDERDKVLTTSLALRLAGAAGGSAICIGVALSGLGMDHAGEALALALLGIASLFTSLQVFDFWFQYRVESHYVCKMRLAVIVSAAVAKILAVVLASGLAPVALVYAVEMAAIGIGFGWLYRRRSGGLQWSALDWSYGRRLLRQSGWLILSGVAAVIYLKIDQVMLAAMASRAEVGTYAVAARLSEVWYFFPNAVVISFFPSLLEKRETNLEAYHQRLQQLCDALFMGALLLAVIVSLIAQPLIAWVFGPQYSASAAVLQIHIWAALFVFMRALASKWLLAEHILFFSFVSQGLGAVINVLANWVMIPLWGGKGAALATLLSYAMASHLAMLLHPKTLPIGRIMNASILLPLTLGARYWKNALKA